MKKAKVITIVLLLICTIMFVSQKAVASDYDIEVHPTEWDFGDVEVGSHATQIFQVINPELYEDLFLYSADIFDDATSSFSITSIAEFPIRIPHGEMTEIEVTFSPTSLGSHSASLVIVSSVTPHDVTIPLFGTGIEPVEDPAELMTETIAFFDVSVENGSLYGAGPGNSANGRLNALENMLQAAEDHINAGEYELACEQLWDAYYKCDGETPPPDFVDGPVREDLAAMILDVIAALDYCLSECESVDGIGKNNDNLAPIKSLGITSGIEANNLYSIPFVFQLAQNYPNPFNPKTIIKFSVPEKSFISLKVYNSLGKEVAILVEENREAGIYEIPFQAVSLQSGIYFYRLVARGKTTFTKTMKMILLK